VTVEVADSDLTGLAEAAVRMVSTTEPAGRTIPLYETTRRGVFRGTVSLVGSNTPRAEGELRVRSGDVIRAEYEDLSRSCILTATGRVETIPPVISQVISEPEYLSATVRWTTSSRRTRSWSSANRRCSGAPRMPHC